MMKPAVLGTIILILALIVIGFISIYGYGVAEEKSRTVVQVPPTNRDTFSDVFVLLDGTGTMSKSAFRDAKAIVKGRIIEPLGVNDIASCYMLAGRFDDDQSIVFGKTHEEQPPALNDLDAREILSLYKAGGDPGQPKPCSENGCKLIEDLKSKQQKVEAVRTQWFGQVDELTRPEIDGSDYVGALEGIKRQLGGSGTDDSPKQGKVRDTWLFIVGDLIHESKKAHPDYSDNAAFKQVDHIVLIYPFNSDRNWEPVEKFWGNYFGDIKTERRTFAQALRDGYLIKPNPTLDLKLHRPQPFSDNFRPYLVADLIVLLITALYFVASFISQKLSARRPTLQKTRNVQAAPDIPEAGD
jgi:hypothetical protein